MTSHRRWPVGERYRKWTATINFLKQKKKEKPGKHRKCSFFFLFSFFLFFLFLGWVGGDGGVGGCFVQMLRCFLFLFFSLNAILRSRTDSLHVFHVLLIYAGLF